MKSIIQSIKTQYCELIASGKKTIEVRKTRPKIQTPFKVYIYCTKNNEIFYQSRYRKDFILYKPKFYKDTEILLRQNGHTVFNGKVIGEYVCYDITKYTTEFHPCNNLFQGIWETIINEEAEDEYGNIVTGNDFDNPDNCDICKRSCLSFDDIRNYIGYGDREFYAWHISDLVIYDKPKELSEFHKECTEKVEKCKHCKQLDKTPNIGCDGLIPLTRPPQSWCYVEEVTT